MLEEVDPASSLLAGLYGYKAMVFYYRCRNGALCRVKRDWSLLDRRNSSTLFASTNVYEPLTAVPNIYSTQSGEHHVFDDVNLDTDSQLACSPHGPGWARSAVECLFSSVSGQNYGLFTKADYYGSQDVKKLPTG